MIIKDIVNYCLYDLETTGLDANKNRILEYGCLRVRDGIVVDECRALVNPKVQIPYFISQIHGITNEILDREGIEPAEGIKKSLDFIGDDIVIGLNNIAFDLAFTEVECNRFSLPRPNIERWFDVGIWHKGLTLGHVYNEKEFFYRYSQRIKDIRARVKYSLDHLVKTYGVENLRDDGLHGAIKDLKMTFHIFEKMKIKYCGN